MMRTLIDDSSFERSVEIARTIQEKTGLLPALDDARVKPRIGHWSALEGDGPLDDLIEHQNNADPVRRAVVGAALYGLLPKDTDAEEFDWIADALRRFVSSVPVSALSDPLLLRWESHAAASAGDLERVLAIGRRFEDLGATPEHLGLVATTLLILVHPASERPFTPSWFDPDIRDPEWNQAAINLLVYLLATIVNPHPNLTWTDPLEFSDTQCDAVLVIDGVLARLKKKHGDLSPTQQAIKSWCAFAIGAATNDRGKLAESGATYLTVARHPLETHEFNSRPMLCRAAVDCFARGMKWAEAVAAAKEWCGVAPADPEAHRRLAETLYKDHRIPEAIDAYETYVRLRKESTNDWEPNLLLRLGLDFLGQNQIASSLETAALATGFREQGQTLATWFSDWFPKLSNKARERWWVGLFTLSEPAVVRGIGDARWDQVADCFGEAVAFELKERVFRPFATSNPELKPPDNHWARVLAGKGMLGQMIECLLQARAPVHPAARELRKWLDANRPAVPKHLSKVQPHRLLAFAKLRGQAQHGSVTEAEARTVFAEASELLKAIVGG